MERILIGASFAFYGSTGTWETDEVPALAPGLHTIICCNIPTGNSAICLALNKAQLRALPVGN